jgi:nucleotide-binding universal stress UspA family protein
MAYKSLLTVATRPAAVEAALAAAIPLARKWDAHLSVLCIGIEQVFVDTYFAGASIAVRQDLFDAAKAAEAKVEAVARARLTPEDIRWSVEGAISQPGLLATLVATHARFADLVILSKPYGAEAGDDEVAITEAALFDGHAPVLILPEGGLDPAFSERIVVGWNESNEAMSAVRAAMPLLSAARMVDIAVIDPRPHGPERSDPGGGLSEMLARHGARTEVSVLAKTLPRVSEILSRHAMDRQAGLIVMGAYSHSRIREAILGGATRAMLEVSKVPVLMAR